MARPGAGVAPEVALVAELTRVLPLDHAAVDVTCRPDAGWSLAGSDPVLERFRDQQRSLAEGPLWDVFATRRPLVVSDLDGEWRRWPVLRPEPGPHPLRSLVLLPLVVDQRPGTDAPAIGLLTVARCHRAPFDVVELALLDRLAGLLAVVVAGRGRLDRHCLDDLDLGLADLQSGTGDGLVDPVAVATGMVMSRLGVSPEEAGSRLGASAFLTGRTVRDLAREVVDGTVSPALDAPPER